MNKKLFLSIGIFIYPLYFTKIEKFPHNCLFQIGLLGMARELQRDLNRIAETADTSTTEGLSYILTGRANMYICN